MKPKTILADTLYGGDDNSELAKTHNVDLVSPTFKKDNNRGLSSLNPNLGWLVYIALGILGGLAGSRLKIPAGSLIAAMLTIIAFNLITKTHWVMPKGFNFVLQVALGIMVGASFQPAMLPVLKELFLPVLTPTATLVGVGILLSVLFTRMQILDAPAAYLSTSPGAMSALIVLAFESGASATLVVCFHFFRVVFVILTAPLLLKLFSY